MASKSFAKNRDISIDLLRGSVVLLMIITHTNALFYATDNVGWLGFFTWLGATVCFTAFLFCSGAVYGMKFSDKSYKFTFERLWQRVIYIMSGYYVSAFAVVILSQQSIPSFNEVMRVIFLIDVPIFTEFIVAFALVDILVYILQGTLRFSLRKPIILLFLAASIYFASRYLYRVDLYTEILNSYKSLFVGHEGLHRFGVLSYFPILSLGLAWGYWNRKLKMKQLVLALLFLTLVAVNYIVDEVLGFKQIRFPPSLLFLSYGVAYIVAFIAISPYLSRLKHIVSGFSFLSFYTFEYYQLHIVVMYTVSILLGGMKYGALGAFLMSIIVIAIVTLLVKGIELRRGLKRT